MRRKTWQIVEGLKKERTADKSGRYGTETQITPYEYHGTSDFSVTFFHSLLLLLPVYTFCSMIINFTQFSFDFPCKIIRFTCKFLLCIRIYSQINQKQQRFLSPLLLFLKKLRFKIPARPFLPEMPDSL